MPSPPSLPVAAGDRTRLGSRGPLILDLQAIQSVFHRDRGIGRWALEFTKALCAERPELVGAVVLRAGAPVPDAAAPLVAMGKVGTLDQAGVGPGSIYHVLSPFEPDQAVEGIWPAMVRESPARLVVTLYDLIPEVYPARYLAEPGGRRRYRTRLELIRAADRVLAISEATRQEGIARLGLHAERVTNIGAGISRSFVRPSSRQAAWERARASEALRSPRGGLERSFILSVGGEDERKNLEGLIAAYARLPEALRARYQLVIACHLTEGYRAHLRAVAGDLGVASRLLVSGYVDDATLIALYQSTELFVFPSLYEGFGLPVAEAMACGAPVVASNTSATAEIAHPAGQFDPADAAAMARAMAKALDDPETRELLLKASKAPGPTWAETARKAAAVYEELV